MRPDNDAVAGGLQEPDNGKSRKALLQCNRKKSPFIIRELSRPRDAHVKIGSGTQVVDAKAQGKANRRASRRTSAGESRTHRYYALPFRKQLAFANIRKRR